MNSYSGNNSERVYHAPSSRGYTAFLTSMIVIPLLMLFMAASFAGKEMKPVSGAAAEESPAQKPWGIDVIGVRTTAAGHMLEFRYRVVDSDKAGALFERKNKPHLVHQRSGKVLAVPNTAKLGPLRNTNIPLQGRTYWMFFGNAGQLVKAGDKVTVAIGDYQSQAITVE
jgi:hypothetical protein